MGNFAKKSGESAVWIGDFDASIPADIEGLFQVFCEWNKEYIFDRALFGATLANLGGHNSKVIVARMEGAIVGYAQVSKRLQLGFAPYLEVEQILVAERYQRNGIGGLLMREAELFAIGSGIKLIKLESELPRSRSHVFYEDHGYAMTKASKFYQKVVPLANGRSG